MSSTLAPPTFNWKSSDQIHAWETFKAKAELWLAGEKVDPTIQYTKIVIMLGDEGLSRWKKFNMSDEDKKDPEKVFKEFRDSFGKDVSYRTARATLYKNFRQHQDENNAELDIRLSSLINDCNFPSEEITKFHQTRYPDKQPQLL